MRQLALLFSIVALAKIFAAINAAPASAQRTYPADSGLHPPTVEQTRAVLEPYFAALVAREDVALFFAEDVVLVLVETGQKIRDRDAVAGTIVELHSKTFDAHPEIANEIVGAGNASVEAVFTGTHTGEFASLPARGLQVRVPYTVFYDVGDGEITALRIYGFAGGLMTQLTAGPTPAP